MASRVVIEAWNQYNEVGEEALNRRNLSELDCFDVDNSITVSSCLFSVIVMVLWAVAQRDN